MFRLPRLYAIVDPLDTGQHPVALAEALLAGGARCLQLRWKPAPPRDVLEAARAIRLLAHAAGALFLVNDRPDLAILAAADGVHLGQDDLPLAAARRVLGPGRVVGLSTHDPDQARRAADAGADYVAVGPVYAVGFSNGAMMSYAWACARPGALAGIGPVAGALTVDCPAPAPLTVVAVHGTRDERVPVEGGRGPSGVLFPSLDASLAPFRSAAACPTSADPVDAAPARVDVRACAGHTVVSDVVDGLPHVWPGAGPEAGRTDGPLDATGFLWAHLRG